MEPEAESFASGGKKSGKERAIKAGKLRDRSSGISGCSGALQWTGKCRDTLGRRCTVVKSDSLYKEKGRSADRGRWRVDFFLFLFLFSYLIVYGGVSPQN